jgi:DNA-binding transcriptional LysR family regulator
MAMDVHLRDLRYFVVVAEQLHFGRAAQELFISQPALSKQIRALETQLRVTLFDRDRRTVQLSTAGAALLPVARALLQQWHEGQARVAEAAAESEATLIVGMSTWLGRGLLPAVRARFSGTAPHARLRLRQVGWEDPTGGLADTDGTGSDAAFVWLPLPDDRYEWIPVATEPRLLLLPAAHPLARRDVVAFADLLDEPFLAPPARSGALRDYWLAIDARGGRPAIVGAEIANTDETLEAVTAGLGVCLIAAGSAVLFHDDAIAVREVTGVSPAELVLAWRRDDRRPLLHALVDATRASRHTPLPAQQR